MNAARVAIRLAVPGDAEALALLSRDTIEAGLPWRWRPPRIAAFIASERHNVIVTDNATGQAGFAVMSYGERDAYLALLAVAPWSRRSGVARALLGWLMKTADVAGIANLTVELREDNLAARRLYEDAGFSVSERRIGGYYGRVNQLCMRLSLRPEEASI